MDFLREIKKRAGIKQSPRKRQFKGRQSRLESGPQMRLGQKPRRNPGKPTPGQIEAKRPGIKIPRKPIRPERGRLHGKQYYKGGSPNFDESTGQYKKPISPIGYKRPGIKIPRKPVRPERGRLHGRPMPGPRKPIRPERGSLHGRPMPGPRKPMPGGRLPGVPTQKQKFDKTGGMKKQLPRQATPQSVQKANFQRAIQKSL